MTLGNQLEMGDVEVNWDDAMNPFTYDETQGSNMFDASKTEHNQRVAAVEAHEQAKEELQEQLEVLDNELEAKQLEDICAKAIDTFICNGNILSSKIRSNPTISISDYDTPFS